MHQKALHTVLAILFFTNIVSSIAAEQIVLPTKVNDGLEVLWTIDNYGTLRSNKLGVSYGTQGSARQLQVDKKSFPKNESAQKIVFEDGVSYVIGPKVFGTVHVTRKIYFGKGEGLIRVIDVFENRSTTSVSINVDYLTYLKSSDTLIWKNDHTIVSSSSVGVAAEVLCGEGGAQIPKLPLKHSSSRGKYEKLPVPPQSKVALLYFVGVRDKKEQALQFAQKFKVAPACKNIDPTDLACIVNFDPHTLGAKAGIEIFRGDKQEVLLLKSGDKLTGTVQNESFRIQTSYAQLQFPVAEIATIIFEGGQNNIERIIVLNGDVFSGFILDPEVRVKLAAGPSIKVRKEKITKLGFRIRETEKEKYPINHLVTLTNGDHFSGVVKNTSLRIGASFGEMQLETHQIAKIEFISKKGTVTEITLKNGDKVSGFLKDEDVSIKLDFGGEVSIYQDRIEKIIFDQELLKKLYEKEDSKKPEKAGSKK